MREPLALNGQDSATGNSTVLAEAFGLQLDYNKWICTVEEELRVSISTTRWFATEQADRLLGRLAFQIARTIKASGAAEVHDLRVAVRRLMRVLVVLKPCFPRS